MLNSLFHNKKSDSKEIARERLTKVLLKDRTSYSPEIIESLGNDLLSVLSNYMEFDRNNADIHISHESPEEKPILHIEIPIDTMFNK